jgi:DNA-binding MarR family transcriptional regulator
LPDEHHQGTASPGRGQDRKPRKPLKQLKALLTGKRLRRPLKVTEDHILSVLLVRRGRIAVLGEQLFSDPAWDILLELYAARLGERQMSVADLSVATGTPPSVTARWVSLLEGRGLLLTRTGPDRREPLLVELTADAESKLDRLINHWGAAFVSI